MQFELLGQTLRLLSSVSHPIPSNINRKPKNMKPEKPTNPNPLNCPWCGRLTKDLTRHLKENQCNVPEEERIAKPKVKCKYCDKEFRTQGKVKIHINKVHELKLIYCDQCDYKTDLAGNLRLHVQH